MLAENINNDCKHLRCSLNDLYRIITSLVCNVVHNMINFVRVSTYRNSRIRITNYVYWVINRLESRHSTLRLIEDVTDNSMALTVTKK